MPSGRFTVPSGANLSLSDLTVTNGYDSGGTGGGIYNGGTLSMTRCKLNNSSAPRPAAGCSPGAAPPLINSLFTGNSTSGNGGGLFAQGGTLTVNSSFVQNTSTNAGGGMALVNVSSATLKNTLIANNTSVNSSDDDLSNSGSTVNARNSLIETGASGSLAPTSTP
jgi:hypothetical protein